ncbi:hypothetical protein MMC13_005539 [Lambiella insularis]|nr:hypothetical protein [Lambiella insularis]
MQLLYVLVFLSVTSQAVAQAPALLDALRNSGASKFAAAIEADPTAAALYLSSQVQTIFAPADETLDAALRQELTPAQEQNMGIQVSGNLTNYANAHRRPGIPLPTKDTVANLGGKSQVVVSDPRTATNISRAAKGDAFLSRHDQTSNLPSLLNIFSGLGNSVGIVKADVPYTGGLIHIMNGYFTLPQTLPATTRATGHTTFTALTDASNLTAELDSTAGLTALIPTNAAFASSNISSGDPTTPSLMDGHIIPNFVGYLPTLTDGAKLVTQAGTIVTVTVRGDDYYLNNAKIVASNLILENGVAHVLDQPYLHTDAGANAYNYVYVYTATDAEHHPLYKRWFLDSTWR